MKTCITCGMPFAGPHANDIALETSEGPVCVYDVKDGQMRKSEEIFEGGVQFFASKIADGDRALAERLTRKNMKSLSYWQAHPFPELEGPEATDEEFRRMMAIL